MWLLDRISGPVNWTAQKTGTETIVEKMREDDTRVCGVAEASPGVLIQNAIFHIDGHKFIVQTAAHLLSPHLQPWTRHGTTEDCLKLELD
jgi:hypothetical protein